MGKDGIKQLISGGISPEEEEGSPSVMVLKDVHKFSDTTSFKRWSLISLIWGAGST